MGRCTLPYCAQPTDMGSAPSSPFPPFSLGKVGSRQTPGKGKHQRIRPSIKLIISLQVLMSNPPNFTSVSKHSNGRGGRESGSGQRSGPPRAPGLWQACLWSPPPSSGNDTNRNTRPQGCSGMKWDNESYGEFSAKPPLRAALFCAPSASSSERPPPPPPAKPPASPFCGEGN